MTVDITRQRANRQWRALPPFLRKPAAPTAVDLRQNAGRTYVPIGVRGRAASEHPFRVADEISDGSADAHWFTDDDRRSQLAELRLLCDRLSALFAENGDGQAAARIAAVEVGAGQLLETGWTQRDLNDLGSSYPEAPVAWLHPKMPDYNLGRAGWQNEVADLHRRARAVSLSIRALAAW